MSFYCSVAIFEHIIIYTGAHTFAVPLEISPIVFINTFPPSVEYLYAFILSLTIIWRQHISPIAIIIVAHLDVVIFPIAIRRVDIGHDKVFEIGKDFFYCQRQRKCIGFSQAARSMVLKKEP